MECNTHQERFAIKIMRMVSFVMVVMDTFCLPHIQVQWHTFHKGVYTKTHKHDQRKFLGNAANRMIVVMMSVAMAMLQPSGKIFQRDLKYKSQ